MKVLHNGIPPSAFEVKQVLETMTGGRAVRRPFLRLVPNNHCKLEKVTTLQTEEISWEDFRRAMLLWLSPPLSALGNRKRNVVGDDDTTVRIVCMMCLEPRCDCGVPVQTRRQIHQNVARFFIRHSRRSDEELLDDAIAVCGVAISLYESR